MVQNPVLFMTFARPDYARKSWEAIKAAKPRTLYFYSNKGREEKEGEVERNEVIRAYVKEIDWDCDLHTWFRDEYVDVYTSLLGAKQWAFKDEETLIMLEEDCMASLAFFEFCDHFLKIYKNEKKISFITGNNYTKGLSSNGADHFITRSSHHFGWATWKDRWERIDFDIEPEIIINSGLIEDYFEDDKLLGCYYKTLHRRVSEFVKETRCWDYLKTLNQYRDKIYTVTPIYNLVQNVGVEGTHTHKGKGNIFEFNNGEQYGHYIFNNTKMDIRPNSVYDYEESKAEGIRNWRAFAKLWAAIYLPGVYKYLKKTLR